MLHRVSGENSIDFLNIDYDKLGEEVKEINEAKNQKAEQPVRITKQMSGNMYRQKSIINFLENDVPSPEKREEKVAERQPAKKLAHKFDPVMMSGRSIRSARCGEISHDKSPNKYIKSQSANTIWDAGRLQSLAKDSKEKSKEAKQVLADNRRHAEEKRMSDLVDALKETEQRKSSSVTSLGQHSGSGYKTPKSGNSIFDDSLEFNRIPDKTAGEKAIETIATERSEKMSDPYIPSGRARSSKAVVSDLFDALMGGQGK